MSGYLIVDLEVTDGPKFEKYRELVPSIVEKYSGKYLVRGGDPETLEGNWSPGRIVVLSSSPPKGPRSSSTRRSTDL